MLKERIIGVFVWVKMAIFPTESSQVPVYCEHQSDCLQSYLVIFFNKRFYFINKFEFDHQLIVSSSF